MNNGPSPVLSLHTHSLLKSARRERFHAGFSGLTGAVHLSLTLTRLLVAGLFLVCLTAADSTSVALAPAAPGTTSTAFLASLTEQERAWLRAHPVIRVVQDPNWPPIEFADEHGNPTGMTKDYLTLIEQRLGQKFEPVLHLSWQEALTGMKHSEIDMTTTVAETPERLEFLAFTEPYMNIPIVIATQQDVSYIGNLHELAGKKVAAVDGYAVHEWIQKDFPEIRLLKVKTSLEGLQRLQRGEVDAFIDSLATIGYHQAKRDVLNLKIAGATPYFNAQRMGVRKDWAPLAGILQMALDSITGAERDEIFRRWLPLRYEHGFNYIRLWPMAAILTAVLLGLVARNWKLAREIRDRKQTEDALRHTQSLLKSVTESTTDAIYVKDLQGSYLMFNAEAARIVGKPSEAVLGQDDTALFPPGEAPQVMANDRRVIASGSVQTYEESVTSRGVTRTFLSTKGPLCDAQGKVTGLFGIAHDITGRKRDEASLRRTGRALRMVSECNQVLVRASSETELLGAICRIVVDHGGYRMAWVGFAEQNEAKSVRPIAQAGFETGYLDMVNITWADDECGRGPTGTAIRTLQPVIARDIPTDPAYGPWRAAAIQRGYASSATLPLISGESAFGALMVHAGEPDAFNAEELALLGELAGDLAYGITALRTRAEREQGETALHESEAKFRAFVTTSSDVLYRMSPDWSEMRQLDGRGFIADTLKPSDTWSQEYIYPDDQPHVWAVINEAIRTKRIFELEHRVRRVDGTLGWTFSRAIPLFDAQGEIVEWFGASKDVTDRKQAEEAKEHAQLRLNAAQRIGRIGDWEFDLATQVIGWSPQVFEIFGRDPKLGPPQNLAEAATMYDAASKTRLEEKIARAIESGEPQNYELLALRPDGGQVHVQAWAVPRKDDSGKVLGLYGTVQDITERKRIEAHRLESEKQRSSEQAAALEVQRQSALTALSLMEDAVAAQQQAQAMAMTLSSQLDELRRWQQVTLNRESRILSVKKEINDLLAERSLPPRYPSALDEEAKK